MTTEQFIENIKLLMDEYCVSQCMYIPDEVKRREIETWIIVLEGDITGIVT